jgi:hypothetical protein
MHIWLDLAAREAALLGILLLLGAGPASFLSRRFDAGSRIALAPVLGFCVGTCVTTTLVWFAPTGDTYWVLVAVAVASALVGLVRVRRAEGAPRWRERLPLRDIAALLLVAIAVAAPLTSVLHEHHTVGPAVYTYTDVDNYVATQDAAGRESLHAARDSWLHHARTGARYSDLTSFIWSYFADFGSNLDATPLDSTVNQLLGLGATDTYAAFLTVLLLTGALGVFAVVRYFTRSRTYMAVLAGALFGGPFFLELWFDSYQAAIVAIGLVAPFIVLVDDALHQRRPSNLVLIAVLLGTFLTVYPLYVAVVLAAAALMIGAAWISARGARRAFPIRTRTLALAVLAVVVMAMVFDAVAVARDIHYYHLLLLGEVTLPRVGYSLPLSVLPGWIAQTREFWNMPPLGHAGFGQFLIGGILPLVFLGFAVIGLRRYPRALALVGMAVICAVVAEYSFASQQSCTYCAERNLLPLAPIAAILIALGLCALVALRTTPAIIAAVAGVLLVVVSVGERTRVELTRFANASYFMDSATRSALAPVVRSRGSVEEEGFGASTYAQAEQPLVYHLINERAPGRVSIVLGSDAGNAIQYLNFGPPQLPPGPEFDSNYRYVLTRLPGIATDRRTITHIGGVALQERVAALDITPYAGLAVPLEPLSTSGVAWLAPQEPLGLLIAGRDGGHPAWARLTLKTSVPTSIPPQPDVTSRRLGDTITVCVPAAGREPLRTATLKTSATLRPGIPPLEEFPPVMPFEGLSLSSMHVVTDHCVP